MMTCFLHFPLCMLINGLATSEKKDLPRKEKNKFFPWCVNAETSMLKNPP